MSHDWFLSPLMNFHQFQLQYVCRVCLPLWNVTARINNLKIYLIMIRLIISISYVLTIVGCSISPNEAPSFNSQIISDLGIYQTEIKSQTKGLFGVTSLNSNVADLHAAYMIQTSDTLHFITWNEELKKFKTELSLPIKRIESVSLIHYGTFGHIRQIHLTSDVGLIVLSFTIGDNEIAENTYKMLIYTGVPVGSRTKFIRDIGDGNMVIPVFVPAR